MIAAVLFGLIIILVLVAHVITLSCSDIEESSTTISLPFKIELKFKRKVDKPK